MSSRKYWIFLAVVMFLGRGALAADQTEYLRKKPAMLPADTVVGTDYQAVRQLMHVIFPQYDVDDTDFYCVVHLLNWGADPTTIASSRWFIYRGRGTASTPGGRWTSARFNGTRIFGSDTVGVAYVHSNVPAKALTALSASNLADLRGTTGLRSSRDKSLVQLGTHVVEQDYTGVTYQLDVVKKLPAPIQNLSAALGLLQGAAAESGIELTERVSLYAGQVFDILHVPSDITVTGKLSFGPDISRTTTDLGTQTYDNEGLYHWDVSLGIPLRSLTQTDFTASGGQVFAKEVDRTQLLALLNLFIRPIDTKGVSSVLIPSPVIGVALSKKPLQKLFAGASIGLNRAQVFAGMQWTQLDEAPVVAEGQAAKSGSAARYDRQWMIGLNVPVRQVVDFLKAKK
jgi:hypothetical protein